MSTIKISYVDPQGTAFEFAVSEGQVVERLQRLDQNKDQTISQADFSSLDQKARNPALLEAVANALFPESSNQREGFRRFALLYTKVKRFADTVAEWKQGRQSAIGFALEFSSREWLTVAEKIQGDGELTPSNLNSLTYEMYKVPGLLAGFRREPMLPLGTLPDGNHIKKYDYDESAIPSYLKGSLQEMANNYKNGASWLFRFNIIECDDKGIGSADHCPPSSSVNIYDLDPIEIGASNVFRDYPTLNTRP